MSEVLFYHLSETPLERALPGLLEKCLARGWNVVLQTGSEERRDALDDHLWTYRDDAFLPHAREGGAPGEPADHPVWLTCGDDNPNGATVRFLVDGAVATDLSGYERAIYVFDGHDQVAVAQAREQWAAEKTAGHDLTYWQQQDGRWQRKA